MARHDGKIFGIGFYKTGTTSLYEALRILGYRTLNGDTPGSYPGADDGATLIKQIDAGNYRLPTFEQFDAFTDNPYFHIWRQIYELYPDAKYILTVRDEQPWIDSCVKFYRNRRLRPMRVWMFGRHADPSRTRRAGRRGSTHTASTSRDSRAFPPARPAVLRVRSDADAAVGHCARFSARRCRTCPGRTRMRPVAIARAASCGAGSPGAGPGVPPAVLTRTAQTSAVELQPPCEHEHQPRAIERCDPRACAGSPHPSACATPRR